MGKGRDKRKRRQKKLKNAGLLPERSGPQQPVVQRRKPEGHPSQTSHSATDAGTDEAALS